MTTPLPTRTILVNGVVAGAIAVGASALGKASTPTGSNDSPLNVVLMVVILGALIAGSYLAASKAPDRALTTGGLTALVTGLCGVVVAAATGALLRDNNAVGAISRTLAFTSIGVLAGYVAYRRGLSRRAGADTDRDTADDDDEDEDDGSGGRAHGASASSNGGDHDQ